MDASRKEAIMSIWFHKTIDLASITANGEGCMPGNLGIEFIEYGDNWLKGPSAANSLMEGFTAELRWRWRKLLDLLPPR
jgi:hypothetical protein